MGLEPEETPAGSPLRWRTLWAARLALIWERLWPALWPAVGVIGLFLALALSGALALPPGWLHLVILLGFVLALGWALYRFGHAFRLPSNAQAERRIERDSALQHRPLR